MIIAPLLLIIGWMFVAGTPYWPVIALFVYAFLYRPLVDGARLMEKGIITRGEIGKIFNPVMVIKYAKALYLK